MAKKPYTKAKSYAKKDKAPSRTDIQAESIESDILDFWKAIGTSSLKEWDRPWVYSMTQGENAGKFLTEGSRYIYKGGFNQFLIASFAQNLDSDKATLILNRTDMSKIFDAKDFAETPIVKNGIKSLGSIYNRPVEKIIASYYAYPSGARWSGETDQPSKAQIDSLSLTKKNIKKFVFTTFPVWSVHDVYPHLPDEYKAKVDQLIELRNAKGFEFNPEDAIEKHIDDLLGDIVTRQGIKIQEHGNEAYYVPSLDTIQLPKKEQFTNPIVRYATSIHELGHSTKHVLSRNAQSQNKVQYAMEEVVAETTAVMMVKQLEKSLVDVLPSRPDIKSMFDDYYLNAMTYNHGYGQKFDFSDGVKSIEAARKDEKSIVKTILVNIAKAVDMLQNGTYTPEQRLEAKLANFKKGQEQTVTNDLNI